MALWCCDWFADSLGRAGERGMTVAACCRAGLRFFYLIGCPFDPEVVDEFGRVDERTGRTKWPELIDSKGRPVPLTITLFLPLSFCPACGANLKKLITRNLHEFDEFVERHRKYCEGWLLPRG